MVMCVDFGGRGTFSLILHFLLCMRCSDQEHWEQFGSNRIQGNDTLRFSVSPICLNYL